MRTLVDLRSKSLLDTTLSPSGRADVGHQVAGQKQEVDVWFQPDPARVTQRERLGALGRMAALGDCLLEPFSRAPDVVAVRACVRKQLVIDHARLMKARRTKQAALPLPRLWILAAGQPETALAEYRMQPMPGWPEGFWERAPVDRLQIVVVPALPRTRDTLLLRLLGRGPIFRDAWDDLMALPDDAWERQTLQPVLLAFRTQMSQHSLEEEDMLTVKEMDALYAEWEQRMKEEGAKEGRKEGEGLLLRKLLVKRFGPLPEGVVARIRQADSAMLERWAERLLSASTLDEVFAA